MGTIISFDIGTKRIGIAKGTTSLKIATPIDTITRTTEENDFLKISKIIKEYSPEKIVLGLPIHLSGKESSSSRYVKEFGKKLLKLFSIEIIYWDERFSTLSAEKVLIEANLSRKKRKNVIDKLAATIFLQNYLDSI